MSVLAMEHKTTSEDCGLGSVYWAKLTLDAQISNYLVGARALGFEVDGMLYDVLRKPALKPLEVNRARTVAESPSEYMARCLDDIVGKPERYYQRGIVVRLEAEEQDAAFDAWQTAEQIRLSRNAERWPRNVDACDAYHRLCDYWPICSGTTTEHDLRYERTETHCELTTKHRLPMLTSSSARAYRSCPRKYELAYEKGIRPRAAADSLSFGTMIHKGLEAWLKTRDLTSALIAMRPNGDGQTPYSFVDAKAEAMLRGYDARWGDEPLEVLAVEAEFTAPLLNPQTGAASRTFVRAGKLDAVVRKVA